MDPRLVQSEPTNLTLDSVPVHTFGTRRRRSAQGVVLVRENFFLDVDRVVDQVWLAIDGQTSVAAIAEVVRMERSMELGLAVAATVAALAVLAERRMVSWADAKEGLR